jgi:hypothetical protein
MDSETSLILENLLFCKFLFLSLEAKKSRHIFFAQIEGTSRRLKESSTREHFHQLVPHLLINIKRISVHSPFISCSPLLATLKGFFYLFSHDYSLAFLIPTPFRTKWLPFKVFYRQGEICVSSQGRTSSRVFATACGYRFGLACSMYILQLACR